MRVRLRPSLLAAALVLLTCLPAGHEEPSSGVRPTAADVMSLVLAVAAVAVLLSRPAAERLPARVLVFAPVAAAAGVSLLACADVLAGVPGYARYVQVFVVIPLAVLVAVRDRTDMLIVGGALVAAAATQGLVGCVQAVTGTGASYAGEQVRAVGTFGAPDVMGMASVVSFGAIVLLGTGLTLRGRRRAAALTAAALLCVPLALSLSRGTWLALAAAGLVVLFLHSRVLAARVVLAGTAAAIVLALGVGTGADPLGRRLDSVASSVSQPDQSLRDRYSLWRTAVDIWLEHPVTGAGPRGFARLRDTYAPIELSSGSDTEDPVHGFERRPLLSPHNMYLLTLSEQGLLGLAALAGCLGSLAWWAVRERSLVAAGLLTWQLVDFCYGDIGGAPTLVMSVALGLALSLVTRRETSLFSGARVDAGVGGGRR
ncbi:O-antigen ligase-like membrane protein [Nonomuraea fuscirosea]|uniref:O-antigen ligase-like membrane protein n=1 Tax=Nonomuraea fuscirosea TaxID=1291556 RepID=A0A2T0M6M0_9ACTN|nr:O-antigen ligase family protein [Nonomuraea fuscirosea]PRX53025.1 O-antigen ligase-like membrane protein [Nonomuraea fuscirosea]